MKQSNPCTGYAKTESHNHCSSFLRVEKSQRIVRVGFYGMHTSRTLLLNHTFQNPVESLAGELTISKSVGVNGRGRGNKADIPGPHIYDEQITRHDCKSSVRCLDLMSSELTRQRRAAMYHQENRT